MKSKTRSLIGSLLFFFFSISITSAFAAQQAIIANDSNLKLEVTYAVGHRENNEWAFKFSTISILPKTNDNIISTIPQTTKNYVLIDLPKNEYVFVITSATAKDKKGITIAKGILGDMVDGKLLIWSNCHAYISNQDSSPVYYNTAMVLKNVGPLVLCDSVSQYFNDVNR